MSKGFAASEPWTKDFSDNLIGLIEKFDDLESDEGVGEALDEQAAIAGGERSLGDTQQGREVLELLQNGRDAILGSQSGNERVGKIYIGVSDNGVTVANTGAGFNFRKEKVRKAARITGTSAKTQNQIGKYGVGLTSIRSIGEAYEVSTRLDPDTETSPVRVRFSPAAPVAAVNAAVEQTDNESLREFRDGLVDVEGLQEKLNPEHNGVDASIDKENKQRIQDLPLFFYPVVLQSDVPHRTDSNLSRRASQLLGGTHPGFDNLDGSHRFSTAVTVDFEDAQWRELLNELNIDPNHTVAGSTEIDRPSPAQRANQLWDYISYDANGNTGLSPETIVHLGGIESLYLERFEEGEVVERQQWTIEDDPLEFAETNRLDASTVTVTISSAFGDEPPNAVDDRLLFQSFGWPSRFAPKRSEYDGLAEDQREEKSDEDDRVHPRILVPQPGQETGYAPHLYYPISGIDIRFPFCMHAEFLLETSRQNLHQDCIRHNATLLSLCAELLTEIAEAVATEPNVVQWDLAQLGPESSTVSPESSLILTDSITTKLLNNGQQEMGGEETSQAAVTPSTAPINPYPWRLLPPVRDVSTTLKRTTNTQNPSVDRNTPMAQFCGAVYSRLSETNCISVRSNGSSPPHETFLHNHRQIIGAVAALYDLCESEQVELPSKNLSLAFLSVPSLRSLLRFLLTTPSGSDRLATLLTSPVDGESGHLRRPSGQDRLKAWTELLSETLHTTEVTDDGHSFAARTPLAHILFQGTAELIQIAADEDKDKELDDIIEDCSLEGVCLLPCQRDDDGNQSVLVSIEAHRGGRDLDKRRVVRWINQQQSDIQLPTPPTSSTFYMYLLEEEVVSRVKSVLRAAGQTWGIGIAESRPDYFRALIESLASEGIVKRDDLRFLLTFFHELDRGDSDDLTASEGSIHDSEYIQTFVTDEDRRPDFRPRLQIRATRLTPDFHSGSEPTPLKDLYLSRTWRVLRDGDFNPSRVTGDGEIESAADENDQFDIPESHLDQAVTAPVPNLPESVRDGNIHSGGELPDSLAQLLTVLGISALPSLEVLPMYDEAGPSEPMSSSWNPREWDIETGKVTELQSTLNHYATQHGVGGDGVGSGDYLDWISSPDFGPNNSATHSEHCDVQYARGRRADIDDVSAFDSLEVAVASWVWFVDPDMIDGLGINAVTELLSDHGDDLEGSVLRTGWMCTDNHGLKSWQQTIPTLFNWQLRHSTVWTDAPWFTNREWWSDGGDRLAWALVDQDSRATRLFPTVDLDEAPASHALWNGLGVKSLSNLNPTEAAYRLQKLQAELANESLSMAGSTQLQGDRTRQGTGWKTAYTRLLDPIIDYLSAADAALDQLPYLTHLPVFDGQGRWVSVSIEALTGNTEYFESRHQRSWEQRTATDDWLLVWPSQGELKPLARALAATPREQTKPTVSLDAVEAPSDSFMADTLREAETVTLAIAARDKDQLTQDDVETLRDKFRYATKHIKRADNDSFDSTALPGRGRSAVYQTEAGREALVYDQTAASDPTHLASGLCLLFEQEQHLYFRTALDPSSDSDILSDDIPLTRVRTLLDQADIEQLYQDLDRIEALFETLGADSPHLSRSDLNDDDRGRVSRDHIIDLIANGEGALDSTHSLASFIESIYEELTHQQREVIVAMLQRDGRRLRRELLQVERDRNYILKWADKNLNRIVSLPLEEEPCLRLDALAAAYIEATTEAIETWETVSDWVAVADTHLKQTLDWSKKPEATTLPIDPPATDVWLSYDDSEFATLRDRVLACLAETTDGPLDEGLQQYVDHGARPEQEQSEATRTAVAKRRVQDILSEVEPDTFQLGGGGSGSIDRGGIQTRSNSAGSGAIQSHTGRAEFAEQFVLAGVKTRLANWADTQDQPANTFWAALNGMQDEESSIKWHTNSRWDELAEYEDQSRDPSFADSLTTIDNNETLDRALDITSEQGPGYDILDLTGTIATSTSSIDSLTPYPIEVKAVGGSPPYRFRFTVNEFRRALAFISAGESHEQYNPGAYTVLLVDVPSIDSIEDSSASEELADTEIVRRIVLDSKEQLFEWLPDVGNNMRTSSGDGSAGSQLVAKGIAEVVKGGYVTVEIE